MKIQIITAFPKSFSFLTESIPKRAAEKGRVEINIIDLKKFGTGKWNQIDDKPFGGNPGMLLQIEPVYKALKSIDAYPKSNASPQGNTLQKVILTSARGKTWNQEMALTYSQKVDNLIVICGHYEGVDHRIVEQLIDAEVSIGNFILSGGELAAQVISDSIIRLIPDSIGNSKSVEDETEFYGDYKLNEYPQYTRPEVFITDEAENWAVPKILLSGNHAEIEKWKNLNRKKIDLK